MFGLKREHGTAQIFCCNARKDDNGIYILAKRTCGEIGTEKICSLFLLIVKDTQEVLWSA